MTKNLPVPIDKLEIKICGHRRGTRKIKTGLWADLRGVHVDTRTRWGRWLNRLKQQLADHLGGTPTIPQQILIEQIAIKCLKVHLYHTRLFEGEKVGSQDYVLAIQNSLRLDLQTLGLERKGRRTLDLEELLKEKNRDNPL